MTADKLHGLVSAIRARAARLREAATNCSDVEDRFALVVRADEAARCAVAIDAAIDDDEKGDET